MTFSVPWANIEWRDNQLFNLDFQDIYYDRQNGESESSYVFLQHNHLPERWRETDHFRIIETGFGTGLNFFNTLKHWLQTRPASGWLDYVSIEGWPIRPDDLKKLYKHHPEFYLYLEKILHAETGNIRGFHRVLLDEYRVSLTLIQDGIESALSALTITADAWYLDGFAPSKNEAMWADKIIRRISQLSHADTTFATFTAAGYIRRSLLTHGFEVSKSPGFGKKREMLSGVMRKPAEPGCSKPWFKPPHNQPFDSVAIIGAGIAGAMLAARLAVNGIKVDLFDQHSAPAQGASGNPAGIVQPQLAVTPSPEARMSLQSVLFGTQIYKQLDGDKDCNCWHPTGIERHLEPARASAIINAYLDTGLVERQSETSLFLKCGGYLEPVKACQTLCQSFPEITFHANNTIESLNRTTHGWLLKSDKHASEYQVAIIANGHLANLFTHTSTLGITPARGQITCLPVRDKTPQINHPVCWGNYLVPPVGNHYITGATFRRNTTSTETKDSDHTCNIHALENLFPGLAGYWEGISGRASIRGTTPDHLPIAGGIVNPDLFTANFAKMICGHAKVISKDQACYEGLYISAGHGSHGLTTAPLLAEYITDLLLGRTLCLPVDLQHALHPARFIARSLCNTEQH